MKTVQEATGELRPGEMSLWLLLHYFTAERLRIGWKTNAALARKLDYSSAWVLAARLRALGNKRYLRIEGQNVNSGRLRIFFLEQLDATGPLFVKF